MAAAMNGSIPLLTDLEVGDSVTIPLTNNKITITRTCIQSVEIKSSEPGRRWLIVPLEDGTLRVSSVTPTAGDERTSR